MNRALYAQIVARAEVARYDHAAADRDAVEKADDKECKVARQTDRRKRVVAGKVAHDPRVGHVVELLKQLTQKQRQRKRDKAARNGTFGQIDVAAEPPQFAHVS